MLIFIISEIRCFFEITKPLNEFYIYIKSENSREKGFMGLFFLTNLIEDIDDLNIKSFEMKSQVRVHYNFIKMNLRHLFETLPYTIRETKEMLNIKTIIWDQIEQLERKTIKHEDYKCSTLIHYIGIYIERWNKIYYAGLRCEEAGEWYESILNDILNSFYSPISPTCQLKLKDMVKNFKKQFNESQQFLCKKIKT